MPGTLDKDPNTQAIHASTDAGGTGTPKVSQQHKHKRTVGEFLFDGWAYGAIVNTGVIVLSTVLTYLTNHGHETNALGKLKYGWIGEKIAQRGEWVSNKFQGLGMTKGLADNLKMVAFSFLDGSALFFVASWLENRRSSIVNWIDDKFHVPPEERKSEKNEPHPKLLDFALSRGATLAMVIPTALTLNKVFIKTKVGSGLSHGAEEIITAHIKDSKNSVKTAEMVSANDYFLNNTGVKIGKWIESKPKIAKLFGRLNVQGLFKVLVFEAFYSSLCTVGLYGFSRMFAHMRNKKQDVAAAPATPATQDAFSTDAAEQSRSFTWTEKTKTATAPKLAPRDFVSRTEEPSSYATHSL